MEHQSKIRELKHVYRTGTNNLSKEFFEPCLAACSHYRRAAGYFSSSALKTWAQGLPRLLRDDVIIQLLISPELSEEDCSAIHAAVSDETKYEILRLAAERLISEAVRFANDPEDKQLQLKLFCWLVATGHLEIRFGIPRHISDAGIFHDKCGIFDFPWGDRVGFTGSANESISGHYRNYERVHVFRGWVSDDLDRLNATVDDFAIMWERQDEGLLVVPLSEQSLKLIKTNAPNERPGAPKTTIKENLNQWRHQEDAVNAFLRHGAGVLEMATGTGKTRTSLKILDRLINDDLVDCVIISTVGNDLLNQWHKEVLGWKKGRGLRWNTFRHYGEFHEIELFASDAQKSLLVVSRQQLPKLFKRFPNELRTRCVVIHDEVHGLGSESNVAALSGEHKSFRYRLGLSATPEREYDQDGTDFILQELGPVIFRFGLEEAIARGILCEMEYVALPYDLSDEDRKRLQGVYARRAASAHGGSPMSDEEFYNEIARVYKTAEYKPLVFKHYMRDHLNVLYRSIIFVDNREYGDRVLEVIAPHTHLYRTYYAEDDPEDLRTFAAGGIDCLVTCHRISQGIDIQSLTTVVLFASSRSRLETIQRIGRCLRSDPNAPYKRALVVDFTLDGYAADQERSTWLASLSQIQRSE